jgi:hypothetical protein
LLESCTGENAPLKLLRNAAQSERPHPTPVEGGASETSVAPQVKGAINNTLSFTKSASYCAIRLDLAG